MHELESVVLTTDLTEYGLERGDVGTIVLIHRGGKGYEVEFVALDGETVAVDLGAGLAGALGCRSRNSHCASGHRGATVPATI